MDEVMSRLIFLVTDLILPLIVGYVLYQRRLLSDGMLNRLIRINIVAFFTLLSLFSFWALPLTKDVLVLPFFFAFIIAYAQIGSACQNLVLVLLAFPIAQYYYLLHKSHGRSARLDTRGFLGLLISWNQLSILGMAAGLALNVGGVVRPPVLAEMFSYLIHVSAWIAMLPIGSLINFRRARHFIYLTFDMILLRFLIVPAATFIVARLIISDPVIQNSLVLFAGVPAAINATLTARLYHLNVDYTIAVFLVTTVLYLCVLFPITFFLFR